MDNKIIHDEKFFKDLANRLIDDLVELNGLHSAIRQLKAYGLSKQDLYAMDFDSDDVDYAFDNEEDEDDEQSSRNPYEKRWRN